MVTTEPVPVPAPRTAAAAAGPPSAGAPSSPPVKINPSMGEQDIPLVKIESYVDRSQVHGNKVLCGLVSGKWWRSKCSHM